MAAPSVTWNRTYVMGSSITGRYEAPITPIATTIITSTSGTYGSDSTSSTFRFSPSSLGTYGGRVVFTATRDLSTYRFVGFQLYQASWPFPGPSAVLDTLANGGVSIVFFDSSANWSEFHIQGGDYTEHDLEDGGWAAFRSAGNTGPAQVTLERDRSRDAGSGTLDWANIDGFELIMRNSSTTGSSPDLNLGSMIVFDPIIQIDGDSGNPAGFDTLSSSTRAFNSSYQMANVFQNTAGNFNGGVGEIYEPRSTYEIGDGSTLTYFRDAGGTITPYPLEGTGNETQPAVLLTGIDRGLEVNQSASDDVVFNGTLFAAADFDGGQDFINVSGSTSGTCTFTNSSFYRKTHVTLTHATCSGGIFDDCEKVELTADTTFTGGNLRNTASTSEGMRYTGVAADKSAITCDFNGNSGIDLSVGSGGAGTYTFTGLTVSGGQTLNVWNESTSNAVTVELTSGVSNQPIDLWFNYDNEASGPFSEGETLTFGNGATATLVVLQDNGTTGTMYCELLSGTAPPDNNSITGGTSSATADVDEASGANSSTLTISQPSTDFTINASESGCDIRIFTTTTQTQLAGTSSGSSLVYTHSSETVDYTIQKAGFLPQRFTAKVLSGTESVSITLVSDPVYDGSHGLTYTTDASWSRTNNELTVPTFGPSVRGVHSLLIDSFISESTLRNTQYNIQMNGPNSMFLIEDAEGDADSSIENMTAGGVRYIDTSATNTAEWCGVESIGTAAGFQGEYQQQDGSGTTDARATGPFDEIIKIYGDVSHGNFDYRSHLVLKYQVNGYYQERADIPDTYGITTIEPTLYLVAMEPAATGIATGDPAISITITDHTASPITVGGKSYDYEIVDNGVNTAEDILREISYNLSLDATYQGKDPFNYPDMVIESGGNYESQYGRVEGQDTTTTFHGFYVSRSSADHPDFSRFQSNDGTYYTPAVTSNISITSLSDDGGQTRLQICNETASSASSWAATTAYAQGDKVLRSTGIGSEQTAGLYFVATTAGTSSGSEPTWDTTVGNTTSDGTVTWTCYAILYYDDDPASTGYSDSYINGEEFDTGDTFRIRFADLNGGTSFKTYETTGVVSATGFTVVASPEANSVYATNAVDGSSASVTNKFSPDYSNNEIDLDTNSDFAVTEAFAYYCYELTTTDGMYTAWNGVTAIDEANYRNNTSTFSLFFDETAGFVKQTDSARWFRDDDARPVRDPTSGGCGVELNWRNPVYAYDGGGGGFTSGDRATLDAAATAASLTTVEGKVDTVDSNVDLVLVDTNELQADWANGGRLDLILDARATQVSVDAVPTAVENRQEIDSNSTELAAIKSKTDSLTFTVANKVDANVKSVNDSADITGTGTELDPWGPP